ncbi:hypothetical protein DID88_000250 [Monilinia fructigena]|uniref:Endonuclease/exonuclease/phosphatase domain-containing protein n=1 Tax=Monilinia fructigena TaxID=38457 RepID=A0A395IJU7_9HELO|nr:hypothetical protein DID88_000250 [Monilinia fructigena]
MFEPGVESSNQGASLAAWSLDSGADFIGEPGEPTHRAGHTIDLTFSNIPFAETTVRHDLDCGSDHFTLITIVPERGQGADSNTGFRVTEANLPRLRPPRNGRTATDTSMDNDHLAGGSGKGRDRRVKHLPWIGPRHRTTAKSLLAAYQSVHKKLLPEMLRAIAFPIRLEASGGGNASEGGKKGQVVGTLLETNRTIVMHWERSGAAGRQKALLGGDTLWSNQPATRRSPSQTLGRGLGGLFRIRRRDSICAKQGSNAGHSRMCRAHLTH